MQKSVKALLAALIVALLAAIPMFPAASAAPQFTATASTTKAAYYLGEDVTITFKLAWQGLSQNYTVNVVLANSTADVEVLESNLQISGENGSISKTYTVSGITNRIGSQTYYVKAVETSTGLTVAQAQISFVVQSQSVMMSIAWADANNDRQIDPQETVTFTVYINWAFVNQTINAVLKVNDGIEKVIDNVQLSAGSGSAQKTYVTSFESAGAKTLTFWLEDANGNKLATKSITLTVGAAPEQVSANQGTWLDQINSIASQYAGIILILVVIAILVIFWKLR